MKTSEKRDIFRSQFSTRSHGCSGECHCGIMHYDSGNYWDDDHAENTLPNAEDAAKEHPELYQFHFTAIESLNLNGRLYVIGCRCKMDEFIFEFLNEEKESVISFYRDTKDRISISDAE